jgi:cathepsin X
MVLYLRTAAILSLLTVNVFARSDEKVPLSHTFGSSSTEYVNEFKVMDGHKMRESYHSPLPYTYLSPQDLPEAFSWGNVNGTSYLTHSVNQHIDQYCGSCWAMGSISALADRINIAKDTDSAWMSRDPINLSVQYILNCGAATAGSCHGGSATGVYEHIKAVSGFVPYETCMPYQACSSDSTVGFCPQLDFTCSPINTCRTCDGSGQCHAVSRFPNATVAEYGTYSYYTDGFGSVVDKIKAEIYARGPVAASINASPILKYAGGVVNDTKLWNMMPNHIVSIVGWGVSPENVAEQYWIVRNSWGQYWGEMGYFRILAGHNSLGIEGEVVWATPGSYTVENYPCNEDASNCNGGMILKAQHYKDPSKNPLALQKMRREHVLRRRAS